VKQSEDALKNVKEAIQAYLEVKTKLLGRIVKGEQGEVVVEAPSALLA
jgi:predicted RNase H-like HicB family nuclease